MGAFVFGNVQAAFSFRENLEEMTPHDVVDMLWKHSSSLTVFDLAMGSSDNAAAVHEPYNGGIDLNTDTMNWNIKKDGFGVEMNVDPAMIERVRREGINSLTPEIFRVTPMTTANVWTLIGLEPPKRQDERLAGA